MTVTTNLHTLPPHALDRAYFDAQRRMAQTLSPPQPGLENAPPGLIRRWATVSAIDVSTATCSIQLDGGTITGISFLASYLPVSGDAVLVDFLGTDPMILGTKASATRGPSGLPPGAIIDLGSATVPLGFLLCNGAAVSRTIYAALFAQIGTSWGVGDGSTTFNLPDLRGRVTLGSGTGSGLSARSLAGTGGEENHILVTSEVPGHTHGFSFNLTVTPSGNLTTALAQAGTIKAATLQNNSSFSGTTDAGTGGGGGHNTMQPWAATTKIIKL